MSQLERTEDALEVSLLKTIESDLEAIRKTGEADKRKRDLLKLILSEAKTESSRGDAARPITDADVLKVVKKRAKDTAFSLQHAEKQGKDTGEFHEDLAIYAPYLPASVSEEEVAAFVRALKNDTANPLPPKPMGHVMAALKQRFGDAFDGKTTGPIVNRELNG